MKHTWLSLFLLFLAFPALALDLPLREKVEVDGSQVMLRDLLSASDAARLDKVSGPISLFRAPEPGMKRKVSRQTLARLVGRQDKNDQLQLTGAASVTLKRKGVWIEPVEVEAVLNAYLSSAAAEQEGIQLSFETLNLPTRFMVPVGKIEHQVIPSAPKIIGSRRMTLITRVDGEVVSNRGVQVVLKARAQVVIARGNLKRGTELSAATLELQTLDISGLDEPFYSIEKLLGKKLKQQVRLGQPLQRRQVDFPPLIGRGEQVTIQARRSGMILKASGEARQNGERGEAIRVRNNSSQREVVCRVVAHGLVSVEF